MDTIRKQVPIGEIPESWRDGLGDAEEVVVTLEAVNTRQQDWLAENAQAFAAQAEWHERNGHPLAEILASPAAKTWSD